MKALSRTAAKRQAHGESSIFQVLVGHWGMHREGHDCTYGLTYSQARAELARWRVARVRELMGGPQ